VTREKVGSSNNGREFSGKLEKRPMSVENTHGYIPYIYVSIASDQFSNTNLTAAMHVCNLCACIVIIKNNNALLKYG